MDFYSRQYVAVWSVCLQFSIFSYPFHGKCNPSEVSLHISHYFSFCLPFVPGSLPTTSFVCPLLPALCPLLLALFAPWSWLSAHYFFLCLPLVPGSLLPFLIFASRCSLLSLLNPCSTLFCDSCSALICASCSLSTALCFYAFFIFLPSVASPFCSGCLPCLLLVSLTLLKDNWGKILISPYYYYFSL